MIVVVDKRASPPAKPAAVRRGRARLTQVVHAFLQAQAPKVIGQLVVLRGIHMAKADLSADELDAVNRIIAGVDFSGWAVLVGEVEPILREIVSDSAYAALAHVGIEVESGKEIANVVNRNAVDYAEERAAEMVGRRRDELGRLVENPNAEWRIDEGTRDYLRAAVSDAIAEGQTNAQLAQSIQSAYAFSQERATLIARTETNRASNAGALNGYKASGVVEEKLWLTADDDLVSEECQENGDAGAIALDEAFPSGDDAPPVHPNCRCAIAPVIASTHEPAALAETADTESP